MGVVSPGAAGAPGRGQTPTTAAAVCRHGRKQSQQGLGRWDAHTRSTALSRWQQDCTWRCVIAHPAACARATKNGRVVLHRSAGGCSGQPQLWSPIHPPCRARCSSLVAPTPWGQMNISWHPHASPRGSSQYGELEYLRGVGAVSGLVRGSLAAETVQRHQPPSVPQHPHIPATQRSHSRPFAGCHTM